MVACSGYTSLLEQPANLQDRLPPYISSNESADVDYSLDGGTTFVTMLHWNSDMREPPTDMLPFPPELSGQSGVIFRFHYDDGESWAWWWEIDDVQVVGCIREGVILEPEYQSGIGFAGELLTYTLSLENCTMVTDTFDLEVSENTFPTCIEPITIENLPYVDVAQAEVSVQSWCDANYTDQTSITALGQSSGEFDTGFIATLASTEPLLGPA